MVGMVRKVWPVSGAVWKGHQFVECESFAGETTTFATQANESEFAKETAKETAMNPLNVLSTSMQEFIVGFYDFASHTHLYDSAVSLGAKSMRPTA